MRQWTLLTVIAALAILVGGYFLLVQPKADEAAELRAETEAQLRANRALQQDINRLKEQAKDLPRQQAKLAAFAQRIPASPALPSLIRSLTDAADKAGVDLVSLAPSAPEPVTAAAAAATTTRPARRSAANAAVGDEALFQIGVQLQVRGGFVQVQQFFSNLEDLTRTYQVQSFTVAPTESETLGNAIAASLSGRVFMTTPPAAPAAPVSAATPSPAAAQPTATATPAQ